MEKKKLDRINFLARKSRESELTPEEKEEQKQLRDEYRKSVVGNLEAQLNNTYILEPDGRKVKVHKRGEDKNGK